MTANANPQRLCSSIYSFKKMFKYIYISNVYFFLPLTPSPSNLYRISFAKGLQSWIVWPTIISNSLFNDTFKSPPSFEFFLLTSVIATKFALWWLVIVTSIASSKELDVMSNSCIRASEICSTKTTPDWSLANTKPQFASV